MSARTHKQLWLVVFVVVLIAGLMAVLAPQQAVAQCEDPHPSCCTCHAEAHPVGEQGEWHTIHARKECCRACHGGNDRTDDQEAAHVGMTLHPLDDTYLACHQCHPDDYRQRAGVFAVALNITPQSSEPTTRPAVAESTPPPLIVTPLPQTAEDVTPIWNWPALLVIALVAIGLAVIGWRRLR
jgi:hypothetical protein